MLVRRYKDKAMTLLWQTELQDIGEILQLHFFETNQRQPDKKELAQMNLQALTILSSGILPGNASIQKELARMQRDGLDYDEQEQKAKHLLEMAMMDQGKLPAGKGPLYYDPENIHLQLRKEDDDDFDFLQEGPPT